MFTPNGRPAARFNSITFGKMYFRRVIARSRVVGVPRILRPAAKWWAGPGLLLTGRRRGEYLRGVGCLSPSQKTTRAAGGLSPPPTNPGGLLTRAVPIEPS